MNLQKDPGTSSSSGARCAQHPTVAAFATCTRCGNFICTNCYSVGADSEYYCLECDLRVPHLALGDRGDRFLANLVDNFVFFIPIVGAGIFAGIFSRSGGLEGLAILLGLLATLGVLGYQIALARHGQSIGKRMRRLRVVRMDGSPASLGRILLLRNFVPGVIGSFCGFFSLVDVLTIFGEERRCIHDLLADTKVVKVNSDMENG